MDKRYQVFLSSTYADLKDERHRVIQALMEMDCIPAGMELFPAADDEQWEFIKRIIDDCDYYLLIIGGRYGSITKEGVSYTEKEFDYALQRGIKVVAFLHGEPGSIPVNKSEMDPALRTKLDAFRKKVALDRLVKFWKSAEELPGLVALSLSKTIKTYPAIGWVRASSVANEAVLIEINELRKENSQLRTLNGNLELELVKESAVEDLADIDSNFTVVGSTQRHGKHTGFYSEAWTSTLTWRKLFSLISPYLMIRPAQLTVEKMLDEVVADHAGVTGTSRKIVDQTFKTITIQFKALGLVSIEYLKTTDGGMGWFWTLTPKGEKLMTAERTIKKPTA